MKNAWTHSWDDEAAEKYSCFLFGNGDVNLRDIILFVYFFSGDLIPRHMQIFSNNAFFKGMSIPEPDRLVSQISLQTCFFFLSFLSVLSFFLFFLFFLSFFLSFLLSFFHFSFLMWKLFDIAVTCVQRLWIVLWLVTVDLLDNTVTDELFKDFFFHRNLWKRSSPMQRHKPCAFCRYATLSDSEWFHREGKRINDVPFPVTSSNNNNKQTNKQKTNKQNKTKKRFMLSAVKLWTKFHHVQNALFNIYILKYIYIYIY